MFIVRWPSGVTKIRQRAVGGSPARGGRVEVDPDRADVVREDLAELVVGDLADERALRAERGEPGQRVGRRAARDLPRRAHRVVELAARASVSTSVIPPRLSRSSSISSSSHGAITSTMALPMAITSIVGSDMRSPLLEGESARA